MKREAQRFVRLARGYAWTLLVTANLTFAAGSVLLWLSPESELAKQVDHFLSAQSQPIQFR